MTTNHIHTEFMQEMELEMQKLETDRACCFSIYNKMYRHVDSCLNQRKYKALFELLPYFEEPDSHPQFHYSAETKKIYILLQFLRLELKYRKESFLSTVYDFNSFLDQYLMTVFAMRRLELELSEQSMAEANAYLTSIPLNIYAAIAIIENEYFENYENLYWNLYICMKSFWPIMDKIQWLIYLLNKAPSQKVILELVSLYMEIHDYSKAYQYLITIPSPSEDVNALIFSLKELLKHDENRK